MKLVFCKNCEDIFKIAQTMRTCDCGKCSAVLEGSMKAKIQGDTAIPIGINDSELFDAVINRQQVAETKFLAFVIPEQWPTIG